MTFSKEDILAKIIEIVEPDDPVSMDTIIVEHDDMDSLAMFNIFRFFREQGLKVNMDRAVKCFTVRDLVELIDKAQ